MYDELYSVWKMETENTELTSLSSTFYLRIADYLKKIEEDINNSNHSDIRYFLLKNELSNVKFMIKNILLKRYEKIIAQVVKCKVIPAESLTLEESTLVDNILPPAEKLLRFIQDLTQNKSVNFQFKPVKNRRITLRFTSYVPPIVGVDIQTYGPFNSEDVASIPIENATTLVQQGLAKTIEFE